MADKEVLLLDGETMRRTLRRLAHEIIEKNSDLSNVILVGILRRGAALEGILSEEIGNIE